MIGPSSPSPSSSSFSSSSSSTSSYPSLPRSIQPPPPVSSSSAASSYSSPLPAVHPTRIPSLIQNLSTSPSYTTSTPPCVTSSAAVHSSLSSLSPFGTSRSGKKPPPTPYQPPPFSSPSSVISSPPSTSSHLSLPLPVLSACTAPTPTQLSHIITSAKLEANRDGHNVVCTWLVKATLLETESNGKWIHIPLLANSVALESSSEYDTVKVSPDTHCYISSLSDKICLVACTPGNYEVCLKFSVTTRATMSGNVMVCQFTTPAPASPKNDIVFQGMTDARVVAQKFSEESIVDVYTKTMPNVNPSCTVPSCDQIAGCWKVTPEDIPQKMRLPPVSSINAKWTVEPKKMKGIFEVAISTETKSSEIFQDKADTAFIDLSVWVDSKEAISALGVTGETVLGWELVNSNSELFQRIIVLLRVPSTEVPFHSSLVQPETLKVHMERSIKLSSTVKPIAIPLMTVTNPCDVAGGGCKKEVKVYIDTLDPSIELRQPKHGNVTQGIQQANGILVCEHPLIPFSSDGPTSITYDAIQHPSKAVTPMPICVDKVYSIVTLTSLADSYRRASVHTWVELRMPAICTGDRKGGSDYFASSERQIGMKLRHTASSSSPAAKPIELQSIMANGESFPTACVLQDHSQANVTKLAIPLVMLPPVPSLQQQSLPPSSPRSVGPLSHENHFDADHGERSSAQGVGRIVQLKFAYSTEVEGDFDGNEKRDGSDMIATLPLPSFDVQVGIYRASVYVNDDPPYALEIFAQPSATQTEIKAINFREKVSENLFADPMPFSSITCNPERRSSRNRYEGGLGLSTSYETAKTNALIRDQISGLGKRDKGVEHQESARDKGEGAAKGPTREIESKDFSQELERDGAGAGVDVFPVEHGTLHSFEAIIIPPDMLVIMRLKIAGEQYLENVFGSVKAEDDNSQRCLSDEDSQEDPCQIGTKAQVTRKLHPTTHLVDRRPSPVLFFVTLVAAAMLAVFAIAVRRVIQQDESPRDVYRHVAELVQTFFERKGRLA